MVRTALTLRSTAFYTMNNEQWVNLVIAMRQGRLLTIMNADWDEALTRIIQYLESHALRVVCSFNLQMDVPADFNCPCAHHGSEACNCSMAVLLVYAPQKPPVSLLVHGHEGRIGFTLAPSIQQVPDREAVEFVSTLMAMNDFSQSAGEVIPDAG